MMKLMFLKTSFSMFKIEKFVNFSSDNEFPKIQNSSIQYVKKSFSKQRFLDYWLFLIFRSLLLHIFDDWEISREHLDIRLYVSTFPVQKPTFLSKYTACFFEQIIWYTIYRFVFLRTREIVANFFFAIDNFF